MTRQEDIDFLVGCVADAEEVVRQVSTDALPEQVKAFRLVAFDRSLDYLIDRRKEVPIVSNTTTKQG